MRQMITIIYVVALFIAPAAHASGHIKGSGHEMSGAMQKGESGEAKKMFLAKKDVDGYTVSFHVMKAADGMAHGGAYNLMVKVEKNGAMQRNILANSKVIHPNGQEESKKLMKMGDWYMAGYDLSHPGRHQLIVLFKTPDGSKHFGGVYYP